MPPEEIQPLDGVPFARSRALRLIGAALIGTALRLTAPELARASDGSPPWPCEGAPACHCCGGSSCSPPYTADSAHCQGGTSQCWYVCSAGDGLYQCCDWHDPSGNLCICVSFAPVPC